jgi:hypothetical protein
VCRFVCITYPLESRQWFKPERVKYVTLAIVLVSISVGLPKVLDTHVFAVHTLLMRVDGVASDYTNSTHHVGDWLIKVRVAYNRTPKDLFVAA